MTQANKNRSTGGKRFYKFPEDFTSLITEFDIEDLWRRQNQNGRLYTHFHDRSDTYSCINRAWTGTNLRVGVTVNRKIDTFSDCI